LNLNSRVPIALSPPYPCVVPAEQWRVPLHFCPFFLIGCYLLFSPFAHLGADRSRCLILLSPTKKSIFSSRVSFSCASISIVLYFPFFSVLHHMLEDSENELKPRPPYLSLLFVKSLPGFFFLSRGDLWSCGPSPFFSCTFSFSNGFAPRPPSTPFLFLIQTSFFFF